MNDVEKNLSEGETWGERVARLASIDKAALVVVAVTAAGFAILLAGLALSRLG